MRITAINGVTLTLEEFPEFQAVSNTYQDDSLWHWFGELSTYVGDLLIKNELAPSQRAEIFNYMEFLLINGDENVQNAVCTCFIENILNRTPSQIDPRQFVEYLGPKSRAYAKAWDEFTGVQTEGL